MSARTVNITHSHMTVYAATQCMLLLSLETLSLSPEHVVLLISTGHLVAISQAVCHHNQL